MTTENDNLDFDLDAALDNHELSAASSDTANASSLDDLVIEEESRPVEAPAKKKGSNTFLIVGGFVFFVLLAGLAFVAVLALSGPSEQSSGQNGLYEFRNEPSSSGMSGGDSGAGGFENSGAVADPSSGTIPQSGLQDEIDAGDEWGQGQPGVDPINQPFLNTISDPASQQESPGAFIEITAGLPIEPSDDSESEALAEAPLTAEELEFDRLLEQTSNIGQLPEGVVIDQAVVRNNVQARKISTIEKEIVAQRASIGEFRTAISDMRGLVGQMATSVASSKESQEVLTRAVKELSVKVDGIANAGISADVDRRLKAMEQAVAKQAVSNNVATAKASAAPPVITVESAQARQAERRQAAAAPKPTAPAAAPTPAQARPRPAVVATPAPKPAPAAAPVDQCAGKPVSQVWRVKGVNQTSAYITRPQDRNGFIVALGVEIPGFGRVVGFNPANRQVCTTSGLIGR